MIHESHHLQPTVRAHPVLRVMMLVVPTLMSALTWTVIGTLFVIRSQGGDVGDVFTMLALGVVLFVFALASFALAVIVDTHPHDHWVLIGLLTGSVMFSGFQLETLIVLVLVFGGLAFYRRAILRESVERIRFSPNRVVRSGLSFTLTLLLLAISIQSFAAATPLQGPEAFLENILNGTVTTVERVAPSVLPGFAADKTVDAYYEEQFDTTTVPADAIVQARQQLAENLRITLTGQETLGEVIGLTMEHRIKPAILDYASLVFPLLVVSLFLLLKLLSPILIGGVLGIGLGMFHLYARLGLVRVKTIPAHIERLEVT